MLQLLDPVRRRCRGPGRPGRAWPPAAAQPDQPGGDDRRVTAAGRIASGLRRSV